MKQTKTKPPILPPENPPLIGVLGDGELTLKIELSTIQQCLNVLYDREWRLPVDEDGKYLIPIWDSIKRLTEYKADVMHSLAKFDSSIIAPAKSRLQRLNEQLEMCVSVEDYEQATKLRDEIRSIS